MSPASLVTHSWLFLQRMQKQDLFLTWIVPTRFVVRTKWIFAVPIIFFLLVLLFFEHYTKITALCGLDFLFAMHFGEEIFWKTLTKSLTDWIKQPSWAIYLPTDVFITAPSASDGPFAWRNPEKWCSYSWRKIWNSTVSIVTFGHNKMQNISF